MRMPGQRLAAGLPGLAPALTPARSAPVFAMRRDAGSPWTISSLGTSRLTSVKSA